MLEVKGLSKIYKPKKGQPVIALNEVNLSFAEKGLVFLLGKSGSGKSTLLNLLGGLDSYSSGEIIIKGKSSANFSQSDFDSYRNTYIGFIFQEFNILEDYTVGQNIGLALELQHKRADQQAISSILKQVDLDGYVNRKPNELSGGQKQRVAIARALIKEPEIIMADEPTGSLDSNTGKQVFSALKKLGESKLVIVVTHDRESAEIYGDRIIELADGKVIRDVVKTSIGTGEVVNQPVASVNPSLIRIERGYQLTQADLNRINELLKNSKADVFISSDTSKNSEFETLAKSAIGSSGGKSFKPRNEKNYEVKKYGEKDFKLVRSKLPTKDAFRMGASGLKIKKVRLIFTIFLSFIAFAMFGISQTASAFNEMETALHTMQDQGIKSLYVQSLGGIDYGRGNIYYDTYYARGFSDDQLENLKDITGKDPIAVYNNRFTFTSSLFDTAKPFAQSLYYTNGSDKMIVVESNYTAQMLNLTPASPNSKLPSADNEIAITDFMADTFIECGVVDPSSSISQAYSGITSYESLVGKRIKTDNLVISGVFSTDIDKTRYEYLKDKNSSNTFDLMTAEGIKQLIINTVFVSRACIEKLQSQYEQTRIYVIAELYDNGNSVGDAYAFQKLNDFIDEREGNVKALSNNSDHVAWLDPAKTSLAAGEILVPIYLAGSDISSLKVFLNECDQRQVSIDDLFNFLINREPTFAHADFADSYSSIIYQLSNIIDRDFTLKVKQMADKTVTIAGFIDTGESLFVIDNAFYETCVQTLPKTRVVQLNSYGAGNSNSNKIYSRNIWEYCNLFGAMGQEIIWKNGEKTALADNEVVIPVYLLLDYAELWENTIDDWRNAASSFLSSNSADITIDIGFMYYDYNNKGEETIISEATLKIVGVSMNSGGILYLADNVLDTLEVIANRPMQYLVTLSGNISTDRALFEYLYSIKEINGGHIGILKPVTPITPILNMLGSIFMVLKTVFFYLSLGFSVFAGLLLMNFIGVSVSHKKRDIGVLRAIGARSRDVFSIFMWESVIIGTINIVLALITVFVTSFLLNAQMGISFLVPGVIQVGLTMLLCYGVAAIATFLPVKKIASKKPIDAINNR